MHEKVWVRPQQRLPKVHPQKGIYWLCSDHYPVRIKGQQLWQRGVYVVFPNEIGYWQVDGYSQPPIVTHWFDLPDCPRESVGTSNDLIVDVAQ